MNEFRGTRFSLMGLMGCVGLAAAGLAAMRDGSALAARGVYSSTLVILLVGLLGVMVRRGEAAWVGFALFGWSSAFITFIPALREEVRPQLISTPVIEAMARRLHESPPEPPLPFTYVPLIGRDPHCKLVDGKLVPLTRAEFALVLVWKERMRERASLVSGMEPQVRNAQEIGHFFLSLASSIIGAVLGKALAPRPERRIAGRAGHPDLLPAWTAGSSGPATLIPPPRNPHTAGGLGATTPFRHG